MGEAHGGIPGTAPGGQGRDGPGTRNEKLTLSQAAREANRDRKVIRRALERQELIGYRNNRQEWAIDRADLTKWINERLSARNGPMASSAPVGRDGTVTPGYPGTAIVEQLRETLAAKDQLIAELRQAAEVSAAQLAASESERRQLTERIFAMTGELDLMRIEQVEVARRGFFARLFAR